jgi:TubC N-terminal docking domain
MTLTELIRQVLDRGIRLSLDDEAKRVRWSAPAGAMTPALLRAFRAHKPVLLKLLGPNRLEEASEPPATEGRLAGHPRANGVRLNGRMESHGGNGPL